MSKILSVALLGLASLLFINTSVASEKNSLKIQLPSIAGPNVYELYTDARYFTTHVYINGLKRELSNASGYGTTLSNGRRLNGALGYANKITINIGLKPSANIVKIVFVPSSLLKKSAQEDKARILDEMYAHAVITRGILSTSSFGISSKDFNSLIQKADSSVKILSNKKLNGFTKRKLAKEISITYKLKLAKNEKAETVDLNDCKISDTGSLNFNAELKLNKAVVNTIKNNSSRRPTPLAESIKVGKNNLELVVTSINKKVGNTFLDIAIECSMSSAIEKINFSPEHQKIKFAGFFERVVQPIGSFDFDKEGTYRASFKFSK